MIFVGLFVLFAILLFAILFANRKIYSYANSKLFNLNAFQFIPLTTMFSIYLIFFVTIILSCLYFDLDPIKQLGKNVISVELILAIVSMFIFSISTGNNIIPKGLIQEDIIPHQNETPLEYIKENKAKKNNFSDKCVFEFKSNYIQLHNNLCYYFVLLIFLLLVFIVPLLYYVLAFDHNALKTLTLKNKACSSLIYPILHSLILCTILTLIFYIYVYKKIKEIEDTKA